MKRLLITSLLSLLILFAGSFPLLTTRAQSGRSGISSEKGSVLNVIVHSTNATADAEALNLNKDRLLLFDGGIQQEIDYFRADPTGSRVLMLVDSSQTLRGETALLQKAILAIIKELYEGDQMMIVDYSEQAEILVDFSDNVKELKTAAGKLPRKGFPKLYDALSATVEDAFRKQIGVNKRAIVLISDGYDRDSQIKYEAILNTLLNENIVIYAFQLPDRTFGAIRGRDAGPKPTDALRGLVEST